MCYNSSVYKLLGGARFELAWLVADGCQDRYVCQIPSSPHLENWAGCSCQVVTPPQSSQTLNFKTGILFCQALFVVFIRIIYHIISGIVKGEICLK